MTMKKKLARKLLGMFLVFCMIATIIPVTVLSDSTDGGLIDILFDYIKGSDGETDFEEVTIPETDLDKSLADISPDYMESIGGETDFEPVTLPETEEANEIFELEAEDYVFTDGVYNYHANADGKTAWISSIAADKLVGAVVVPEIAKDNSTGNEYTVTGLYDAFKNQGAKTKEITSLTLPDTITTFKGTATFYDCKGLTSIHLPANLTGDATGAGYLTKTFYFCSQLTSVEIPAGITKLYGTFNSNSAVRTVYLKTTAQADFYQSSTTAEARAWKDNTTGVTIYYPYNGTAPTRTTGYGVTANVVKQDPPSINFTSGDYNYTTNGDLNNTGVTLTSIAAASLSGDVTVPEKVTYDQKEYTVTRLGDAFKGNNDAAKAKVTDITSITLPETITKFTGTATFYGCDKLASLNIPSGLTGAPDANQMSNTFQFCEKLTSVTLPAAITKCWGTFVGSGVKTVTISSKAQVDFYEGSTTTDARAWNGATGVTIYYPKDGTLPYRTGAATVKELINPGDSFTAGDFTYTVNTDTSTVTLTAIAASALSGTVTVPENVSDGTKEYTVTALGDAFKGKGAVTDGITALILPDTITRFTGTATFYDCKFSSIHLPANLTGDTTANQLSGTFQFCPNLTEVTLPAGITRCWSTFGNGNDGNATSGVKTVYITSKAQVKFFGGSTTHEARAWKDGTTGITIYYPADGTIPDGTGGSFTATVKKLNEVFTSGNFKYKVNDDEETVTLTEIAVDSLSGDITVPEKVTNGQNEYTVTQLGDAFKNQGAKTANMTSLVLPDTITKFTGTATFYGCKFSSVHLPENLTAGPDAGRLSKTFYFCSNLTEVTLPAGITDCYGTFGGANDMSAFSAVRTVYITGTSAVNFNGSSSTKEARAWKDGTDGITIYYPANGTEPVNTGTSFTAAVIKLDHPISVINKTSVVGDDDSVTISTTLRNNSYTGNAMVVCAIYDDNYGLYDIQTQDFSIDVGKVDSFIFNMEQPYADNLTYSIIVLDENIAPLAETNQKVVEKTSQTEEKNSKVNLYENFGGGGLWDRLGNQLASPNNTELINIGLDDRSSILPGEAYRSFTKITGGKATLEFDFSIDEKKDGIAFRLLDGQNTAFGLVTSGGNLCLEQPNGEKLTLMPYSSTPVNRVLESGYYVKADLDLTEGKITALRINGSIVATNKPFATTTNSIDGFDISTADGITAKVLNRMVKLYTNFDVYEMFYNYRSEEPEDWTFDKSDGGDTAVYAINSRMPERYSMKFDTTNGAISGRKGFGARSGSYVFETMALQPEKRDGVSLAVGNGDDALFEIVSDGEKYSFVSGGTSTELYDYLPNVWYGLKVIFNTVDSTADVYVNNKLILEDIAINDSISVVDNINISADENNNPFIFDDVKLYQKKILAADYVPEPVIPNVNKEYVIGMQMCTLWTPGQYNKGWDYIKGAPDRMPILGAYDEGDPEVNDWEIKWMTEHGIDFQWLCAYPNIKYSTDAKATPYKPNNVRQGDAIYEGFMNAEYSDKMKFAIIYEATTVNVSTDALREYNKNDFFEHTLPNWIEYYFKDPRYLKIDGRPIVTIYGMNNFFGMFGSTLEDINAGIARMRNECIEAGVGNPYIAIAPSSYPQDAFTDYANYDIDSVSQYGWMDQFPVKYQERVINGEVGWSNTNNLDFVPLMMPSKNMAVWDGVVGHAATKEGFKEELSWLKNTFAPSMDGRTTSKKLSKKLLNLASWNEYGEGHYFAPTVGRGFDYLDAVREVFVGTSAHTDTYPTASQKQRVNKMIDQDRRIDTVRENPAASTSNLASKKTWTMSNSTDYGEWSNVQNIKTMSRTGSGTYSGMNLTPSDKNPQIELNTMPSDTSLYDVTYIKVRMLVPKSLTTWAGGYIYFKTDQDPNYDEIKRVYFGGSSANLSDTTYYDYYIPVGTNEKWKGNLTGLKFQPGNFWTVNTGTAVVRIKSIELMRDTTITDGYKTVYGNTTVAMKNAPANVEGELMVPAQEIASMLGLDVTYLGGTNEYVIKNGSVGIRIKVGTKSATKLNISGSSTTGYTLAATPYQKNGAANDILYVPASIFSDIFGKTVTQNSKTISITN